jgi:large-conductance mechanosensitive channel
MSEMTILSFAVAIYLGTSMTEFFSAVAKDLLAPVITGFFPGVHDGITKLTVQVGPVKFSVGNALGAAINLAVAILAVTLTLPYVRAYSPIRGGR